MICDLMRNDLGKVSQIGSVKVHAEKKLLTLPSLFHLYSEISSKPLPGTHPVDLLKASFPSGSITGCPKLRSMETIYKLESRPRHIYTGSIGYFTGEGDFDFNVAIRTAVVQNNYLELQVGGAIVYDSDPQKEWEETKSKALSFHKILSHELTKTKTK